MVKKIMNFKIDVDKHTLFKAHAASNMQELTMILNCAIDDYITNKGKPLWIPTTDNKDTNIQ